MTNEERKKILLDLASTSPVIVMQWVYDCVERVLPYFEDIWASDERPRKCLLWTKEWLSREDHEKTTGQSLPRGIMEFAIDSTLAAAREHGYGWAKAADLRKSSDAAFAIAYLAAYVLAYTSYIGAPPEEFVRSAIRAVKQAEQIIDKQLERGWQDVRLRKYTTS